MRITETEREIIRNTCLEVFHIDEIYLFGSRLDDNAKGGDIDLYIKLQNNPPASQQFEKKLEFLALLKQRIGDQKIDVILAKNPNRPIEQEALAKGVKL